MNKLIIILALAFCGIKPMIEPQDCSGGRWLCTCSEDECSWVYICEDDSD